jgi:amino acid permease
MVGIHVASLIKFLKPAPDSDVAASPVTVVFVRAGFGAAAHVVNAVLFTAVLSATNSCFYASSRMLLSLARNGHAPSVFGWVNKRGVPVPALMYVAFILILRTSVTYDLYPELPCSRPSSPSLQQSGQPE